MQTHEIDLGFSMTFNTLQGATVERLVVNLNDLQGTGLSKSKLGIQKVVVALTRVRSREHIAIWPMAGGFGHLEELQHAPALVAWYGNYENHRWQASRKLVFRGVFPPGAMCTEPGEAGVGTMSDAMVKKACRALGMWIKGQSMCQLRGRLVPLLELAQEQVRSAAAGGGS